jgi:PAS domain-containing protein
MRYARPATMKASHRRTQEQAGSHRRPASRTPRGTPLTRVLARVVVWEWDADRDRVIASATLSTVYGVTAIDGVSHGMVLVHPDDVETHQARVHQAVERGRGYQSSFRIIQPATGRIAAIDERAEAIPRGAGRAPLLIGVAVDVTGRPQQRDARSFADALTALQRFCDQMLSAHAAHLRTRPRAADTVALGHWIDRASRELSRLGRVRVKSMRAVAQLLAAAAAAVRNPHHAA